MQLVAFLQQLLTHGGYYDENLEFIHIERIQVGAAQRVLLGRGGTMGGCGWVQPCLTCREGIEQVHSLCSTAMCMVQPAACLPACLPASL